MYMFTTLQLLYPVLHPSSVALVIKYSDPLLWRFSSGVLRLVVFQLLVPFSIRFSAISLGLTFQLLYMDHGGVPHKVSSWKHVYLTPHRPSIMSDEFSARLSDGYCIRIYGDGANRVVTCCS